MLLNGLTLIFPPSIYKCIVHMTNIWCRNWCVKKICLVSLEENSKREQQLIEKALFILLKIYLDSFEERVSGGAKSPRDISGLEFKLHHIVCVMLLKRTSQHKDVSAFFFVVVVFTHNPLSLLSCWYNWLFFFSLLLESTPTFVLSVTAVRRRAPWQREMLSVCARSMTRDQLYFSRYFIFYSFFLPANICWNCDMSVTVVNHVLP